MSPVHDSAYAQFCQPKLTAMLRIVGLDKHFIRGEGAVLWYRDEQGRPQQVIDFLGGYGATLLGHNHPALVAHATQALSQGMVHHGQLGIRAMAGQLGQKLHAHVLATTGRSCKVMQANSGAEAVELALKAVVFVQQGRRQQLWRKLDAELHETGQVAAEHGWRIHPDDAPALMRLLGDQATPQALQSGQWLGLLRQHNLREATRAPVLLGLERAFHGKTTGAVQLTHGLSYREPFAQLGLQAHFLPAGDLPALGEAIDHHQAHLASVTVNSTGLRLRLHPICHVAAFFAEPIQGEGGIHPVAPAYLQAVRQCADQHRFALVIDEIQTGMGRTGTLLHSEQTGVRGDFYLLGKSLGGGLAKISAVLIDDDWYDEEFGLVHSSTFADDDYSSSLACKVLDLIESDRIAQAAASKGRFLTETLRVLQQRYRDVIRDVRGVGLLLGLEFIPTEHGSPTLRDICRQGRFGYVAAGYLLNRHGIRVAPTLSSPCTLRIEPSALITLAHCDQLIVGLTHLCETLRRQNAHEFTRFMVGDVTPVALEDIEDHRWRFAPPTPSASTALVAPVSKVAFLGHLSTISNLKHWDPSLSRFTDEEAAQWLRALSPMVGPQVHQSAMVRSITGEMVLLEFITLYFDSQMINDEVQAGRQDGVKDYIQRAVDFAVERGCKVIGFGGYSSIVTGNCKRVQLRQDVALTTGNSLTVAMGIQALLETAEQQGIDLGQSCFAAVGAAGNIASVYSELMASQVPRLLLIGTAGSRRRVEQVARGIYEEAFESLRVHHQGGLALTGLRGVARALAERPSVQALLASDPAQWPESIGGWLLDTLAGEPGEPPIRLSDDLMDLRSANLILSASSAPGAVLFPQHLGSDPVVVCDIAVPQDVDRSVGRECPNVQVIQGGLVRLPFDSTYTIPGMPLEPGMAFACNAETLLMGLADIGEHYSYGKITKDQVRRIHALAIEHGFTLAAPRLEASY